MIGYIVVVDTEVFGQLEDRRATFSDLESGSYELTLWHPGLDGLHKPTWQIEVGSDNQHEVLSLSVPLLAAGQPEAPVRRFDESADY
jgi:hypothetical protein